MLFFLFFIFLYFILSEYGSDVAPTNRGDK